MNNLAKLAQHIPVNPEVPVISVHPVTLSAPDRGMDLEVRISAPVTGQDLPVVLLSHGHGPSLYIPSAQGYGPIASFWAAHGFVVIQPTHLNAKARGINPEAPGGPAFWKSRVADMGQIIDELDTIIDAVPGLAGRVSKGSGQNMGVVVGDLACAKLSSLRGGLPWTFGLQSKRPSIMGRSALISLTAFHDRTG
jgi:predicted dienelactone hydrolase